LEQVARALLPQVAMRELMQFAVDERNRLFQSTSFASAPGAEQLGNLLRRKFGASVIKCG
jgi:hypothetical protein